MTNILSYNQIFPDIGSDVFIAPNACVIGDVRIEEKSSIWFSCTVRGDERDIRIGKRTNIQDNSVIHVATKLQGTSIGDDVTVGHSCVLHACTIGNLTLIGMHSCILDGATVENNAMVAAGSLVTPGKIVLSGQLWGGRPARYIRDLTCEEQQHIKWSSQHYIELANNYLGRV